MGKKKDHTEIFIERLKEIRSGENKNYTPLEFGNPGSILKSIGIPDLPIEMAVSRLIAKKLMESHPFNLLSIVDLPDCLNNPIAIFQSKTRPTDSKVFLTEMEEGRINFVVAMEMNQA